MCLVVFESPNLHYGFHMEYYKDLHMHLKNDKEQLYSEYNKTLLERYNLLYREENRIRSNVEEYVDYVGNTFLQMKTRYPGLVVGTGYQHESKGKKIKDEIQLGFSLDYVTGMPYIPGSSVKGIIKNAFQYDSYIKDILGKRNFDVDALKLAIFDGILDGNSILMRDRDVFYDAIIIGSRGNVLELDNITPHGGEFEFRVPNPITMLKIGPNVTFQFSFQLSDTVFKNGTIICVADKIKLFQQILEDFGIGGKTNVGYGVLESVKMSIRKE